MNIHYTLPDREQALLTARSGKTALCYCAPFDLTPDGQLCTDGWVAVTSSALFVLLHGKIEREVPLAPGTEILCASQVDSGILLSKVGEEEQFLCRFSMRHMIRLSYVARGATLLCKGDSTPVESREREKLCPKCGRVLPGTSQCPKCDSKKTAFTRFWDLCRPYVLPLSIILVLMAASAGIAVFQQEVQKDFVDDVLLPAVGTAGDIWRFFAIMFTFTVLTIGINLFNYFWSNRLGTRMSQDLRGRVFRKLNELSMSYLHERQAGELMNRVMEDTSRIREFMEQVFASMATQVITMLAAAIMMFVIDWKIALLTVMFAPLAMLMVRVFHRTERRLFRQQWRTDDRVNNRLQDVISGIRVVKSFGQEAREIRRFDEATERLMRIQRRNEAFWATLYPLVTLCITLGSYFVMYLGGLDVLGGRMTPGQLVQMMAYATMLYGPLGYISRLPRMIMRMMTGLERIYDILDEQPDIADTRGARDVEIHGDVTFDRVSFGYRSYEPVLQDIDLTVKQGEMIGIVGSSGAGKSTMINLLMRLYEVDRGRILLDGVPMTDIRRDCLHRQIGVVLQETFLFSGTIYDNIRYAKPDATVREVIEAAKLANAHEFICRFPDGYDTYVGERGYTLSGGERQRIAIARAILPRPRLLILDEATSSLDTETEYQIQEAMARLTKGRTTFAIAHRLSTLRSADRIVVIDRHHIAEVGTHNELMRKKGIYYGLVMAQLEMHKVKE